MLNVIISRRRDDASQGGRSGSVNTLGLVWGARVWAGNGLLRGEDVTAGAAVRSSAVVVGQTRLSEHIRVHL